LCTKTALCSKRVSDNRIAILFVDYGFTILTDVVLLVITVIVVISLISKLSIIT